VRHGASAYLEQGPETGELIDLVQIQDPVRFPGVLSLSGIGDCVKNRAALSVCEGLQLIVQLVIGRERVVRRRSEPPLQFVPPEFSAAAEIAGGQQECRRYLELLQ